MEPREQVLAVVAGVLIALLAWLLLLHAFDVI
jgi:hypothetical protein